MSSNLNITQVSASQNQKEVTINDAIGALDAALTEGLTIDFTSTSKVLTDAEFRGHVAFLATNMAAARSLTVPAIKGFFLVNNPDATHALEVIRGTTTINVTTESMFLFYADGTTNGLYSVAGGGSGGGGTFVSLSDTPANFSGHGGKVVGVNVGETALEFLTAFARAFTDLTDAPSSYVSQNNKGVRVNSAGTGLVFDDYPTAGTNWSVPFRGAVVDLASNFAITVPDFIEWDTEVIDTHGFWDAGSPSRLTVPTGVSRVRLHAGVAVTADASAGSMFVHFYKNGASVATGMSAIRSGTTGFNSNHVQSMSPVLDVTPGDYFEVRINTNGLGTPSNVLAEDYSFFQIEVVEVTAAEEPALVLGSFLDGTPATDEKVLRAIVSQDTTLVANAVGSFASADVAATAQTDFDLQKNGVSIGTIRFAAAGTTATFVSVSATDFVAGDVLTIVAPNPADSTLADISFAMKLDLR